MRREFIFTAFFLAVVLLSCITHQEPEYASPVDFDSYEKYYYKGTRPQSDSTFFFYITSKTEFDSQFMFLYISDPPDTLPQADLSTKKILAVVKYGNDLYDLEATGMDLLKGVLDFKYTCTLTSENMSSTAAVSLIVTVDEDFDKIRFIENGSPVHEIIP